MIEIGQAQASGCVKRYRDNTRILQKLKRGLWCEKVLTIDLGGDSTPLRKFAFFIIINGFLLLLLNWAPHAVPHKQ